MSGGPIMAALVAELRKLPPGAGADRKALRAALGCSPAMIAGAITALRYQGKLLWDHIELAPSMREAEDAATDRPEVNPDDDRQTTAMEAGSSSGLGEAIVEGPADPHKQPASPTPSGAELCAEIRAYCAGHRVTLTAFSKAAVGYLGLLANLSHHDPSERTVARVRGFIAAHPDGLPKAEGPEADVKHYMAAAPAAQSVPAMPPAVAARSARPTDPLPAASPLSLSPEGRGLEAAPPIADQVRAEAAAAGDRRRAAGIPGGGRQTLAPASRSLVEAIQGEAAAEPQDLMRAIRRRHGRLWQRTIALSRARGITPAAALYDALERGLSHVEREGGHVDA